MADDVQGDLLDTKDGGAAAAADGATKGSDTKADAGKAAAPADQGKDVAKDAAKDAPKDGTKADGANGDGKAKDDVAKTDDAPIDYGKVLAESVPEGMKLDDAAAKPFVEAFAKHKISADAVKDLVALQAAATKAGGEQATKAFADQVAAWRTASEADKDLGKEKLGLAKTTAGQVFDTKTIEVAEHFGLMNHPGFLKGLVKIGMAIKDDSFVPGDAGGSGGGRDARSLYPNSPDMNP